MSCAAFTFLGMLGTIRNWEATWVLRGSFVLAFAFFLVAAYKVWLVEHEARIRTLEPVVVLDVSFEQFARRLVLKNVSAEPVVNIRLESLSTSNVIGWRHPSSLSANSQGEVRIVAMHNGKQENFNKLYKFERKLSDLGVRTPFQIVLTYHAADGKQYKKLHRVCLEHDKVVVSYERA
jgi:hypothetical protein